jgi:tRNA(Ile)-lysidine synthase
MEAIFRLMKSGAPNLKVSLPGNLEVCKEYDHLKFRVVSQEKIQFHHEFDFLPKEIKIPEISRRIEIEVLDWNSANLPIVNKNSALMDYNKIKFPIIVRNWKAGDRFQPLGMYGFKKVKDFFIDSKLPLSERRKIPLVLFADLIAWIGGQRIDDRVKITNSTRKAIKMEIY